jgi:hypothetical protein
VDLLIHLKLFVGRFDMRTLQAALPDDYIYHSKQEKEERERAASLSYLSSSIPASLPAFPPSSSSSAPFSSSTPFYYSYLSQQNDIWFDFMSDCGDGWNSSYQVARFLSQPYLSVPIKSKVRGKGRVYKQCRLPRGKVLLIGGDLAYPNPTEQTYEQRFFRPFECALPPPLSHVDEQIAANKPSMEEMEKHEGPACFAIPGNHGIQHRQRGHVLPSSCGPYSLTPSSFLYCLSFLPVYSFILSFPFSLPRLV